MARRKGGRRAEEQTLSSTAGNLLLATRCLGRGTPFPHELMRRILTALDDTASYATILGELRSQKRIVTQGNLSFEIDRAGWDWLAYQQVPFEVWLAALKGVVETVPASCAADAREVLELMVIHAAALANTVFTRDRALHIHLMSLSVECLIQLGELDEAHWRLQSLQKLAAEL